MDRYDYREAVKADVKEYIEEEYCMSLFDLHEMLREDRWRLEEKLQDAMWASDSVTGNASGSYYCNAWKAEEALCHNTDLLVEALEEFGYGTVNLERLNDPEWLDLTIRCYLLSECISSVLDEIEAENYDEEVE